jgi:hypothetical protein
MVIDERHTAERILESVARVNVCYPVHLCGPPVTSRKSSWLVDAFAACRRFYQLSLRTNFQQAVNAS